MIESHAPNADEYVSYFKELLPLAVFTGGVSLVAGTVHTINSFKLNNWRQYVLNVCLRGLVGMFIVFIIVPLLPVLSQMDWFKGIELLGLSPVQLEIAVCTLVAFLGVDTLFYMLRRKFGQVTLDKKELGQLQKSTEQEEKTEK